MLLRFLTLFLQLLVLCHLPSPSHSAYQFPRCSNDLVQRGSCVPLLNCPRLLNLYTYSHTYQTRSYIDKYRCRSVSGGYGNVCCDTESVRPSPNTAKPPRRKRPWTKTTTTTTLPTTSEQSKATTKPPRRLSRPKTTRTLPTTTFPPTTDKLEGTTKPTMDLQEDLTKHPNYKLLPMDECGTDTGKKIFGGKETDIGDYPWAALLEYERRGQRSFQCGGSLINERYVLTAAHCVNQQKIGDYKLVGVRLGEHNTETESDCNPNFCADDPKDFKIEKTISHPNYTATDKNQYNDIALLRLDGTAPTTDYIRPICIPFNDPSIVKTDRNGRLMAAGWGRTESGGKSAVKLKAALPLIDNEKDTCSKLYARRGIRIARTQLCAGGELGVDVCNGDSGGALMGLGIASVTQTIYGIVSYGSSACHYGEPGVYTRVACFTRWILDQLEP